MPRNGSGVFAAPASTWNPPTADTTIDVNDWIALLADMETALTNSIATNGETTTTARIPFAVGIDLSGAASPLKGASFAAYLSASTSNNVTGDGTVYAVVCGTEDHDTLGNFAAGVFTAPVTGKYRFYWQCHLVNLQSNHNSAILKLITSDGRKFFGSTCNPYAMRELISGANTLSLNMSADISLTAGQTVTPYVDVNGSGSSKVVGVYTAGSGERETRFSGHLVVG